VDWTQVITSLITAGAALGGVALGALQARREDRREKRNVRISAYSEWLRFSENLGTWAYKPGADPLEWRRQLQDRKVELDLVASRAVTSAVQRYIDQLDRGMEAIVGTLARRNAYSDEDEAASAAGAAFGRAMRDQRSQVINAMKGDLGL
jgi:hypothetical protein